VNSLNDEWRPVGNYQGDVGHTFVISISTLCGQQQTGDQTFASDRDDVTRAGHKATLCRI